MGAAGAFLGDVKVFVQVNNAIGTGVNAGLAAGAFLRVNDDESVLSSVYDTINGTSG
jgi:hypothetical protein